MSEKTAREVTQFSLAEYKALLAEKREAKTEREKYMLLLEKCLATPTPELDAVGGLDNVQRVRVLENPETKEGSFIFVPKLPPHLLEAKRRAEREIEQARERAKVLAELEAIKSDPDKLQAFLTDIVVGVIGRAVAAGLMDAAKRGVAKAPKAKPTRKPKPKKPFVKKDDFEAALAQDRQARREAAKKAALEYHQKRQQKAS
jgi:hypothetical protein